MLQDKISGRFQRKYNLDESFFDKIDTEAKSYFLGLLYADGCNYGKRNNAIAIGLQERDGYILKQFSNELKTDRPLVFRKATKINWQNTLRLDINSRKISENLIKLGCWPKKDYNLKFPTEEQVPNNLINHFIRGFMDGDGSILYSKCHNRKSSYKLSVSFSSCLTFLEPLKEFLKRELNVRLSIPPIRAKVNKLCRDSRTTSKYDSIKLLNWLYNEATIYLQRKYDIYRTVMINESKNLEKRNLLV